MREEILRRLLVAKHLLAANSGQLAPNSDAATVARMVLVAHDAAELTVAAIASHLNVPGLVERITLTEYASKIASHTNTSFPGADFLRQLNAVRVAFKHYGVLPDARDWYRVVDRTWEWAGRWCQAYLSESLDDVSVEQLLADAQVRKWFESAKARCQIGQYKEALELIAHALYRVLHGFGGGLWPTVGRKSTEDALMLSAFGVRPSDFLALQEFLPEVQRDFETRKLRVEWKQRETGHAGNWTDENVRFCLETFLDLTLKIQHAPSVPRALQFDWVFDDVITPAGESAVLFDYTFEGHPVFQRITGRKPVRTLRRGETLRCRLSPSELREKPLDPEDLNTIFRPKPTLDTAEVLSVWLESEDWTQIRIFYVQRKDINMSVAPKDKDAVRSSCPHLFPGLTRE